MKNTIITLGLCFCAISAQSQTLEEALKAKDTVLALSLIAKGADPNAINAQGATMLMTACHFPDIPTASFLLRHGAKGEPGRKRLAEARQVAEQEARFSRRPRGEDSVARLELVDTRNE
jgi:hypothetical protein